MLRQQVALLAQIKDIIVVLEHYLALNANIQHTVQMIVQIVELFKAMLVALEEESVNAGHAILLIIQPQATDVLSKKRNTKKILKIN